MQDQYQYARSSWSGLLQFLVALIVMIAIGLAGFVGWQRYGAALMAPPQTTVNGARPFAPAPPAPRPYSAPAQPVEQPQPQVQPASAPEPVYQPVGNDAPAPAEAVPAGAPMTEEYRETIQSQDRTNDKGELCLPRSGCTKPGSGGDLAWPNGRP